VAPIRALGFESTDQWLVRSAVSSLNVVALCEVVNRRRGYHWRALRLSEVSAGGPRGRLLQQERYDPAQVDGEQIKVKRNTRNRLATMGSPFGQTLLFTNLSILGAITQEQRVISR
jgi:hypothetical protein